MSHFIQTLVSERFNLFNAILQHIEISLIALVIAIIIAVPVAISVLNHKKVAYVITQFAGVLQTIPSLALLGLLIPLVGIGQVPAVIALVVYAILPIFQNTYIGLTSIDESLDEAANAFGMTKFEKLIKVQLPIALPTIIAGIRQALVMIIGTATLAALIGAGGLGNLILLGIDRNDNTLTIIGALAAAILAIIFSALIYVLQKGKLRYSIVALLLIVAIPVGNSVYHAVQPKQTTITIAGKLGSEPDILINMYKELIEAKNSNTKVILKPNFGQTSFLFNALKAKQIDIYPEFTGTVLESLVKTPNGQRDTGVSPEQLYGYAKKDLKDQFGFDYLPPMEYNNTYSIIVTKAFADKYHLKNISDLRNIEAKLHAGFDLEFLNRADGYKGLQAKYGLSVTSQSVDAALRYEALRSGKVNVIDGFSTDSQIRQYNFVELKDNHHLFPVYQGAPLVSATLAKEHPEIIDTLNVLAGKITEDEMREMNYQVNVKGKAPAVVARDFLVTHHLLGAKEK